MRQYNVNIEKPFKAGLRPRTDVPKEASFLTQSKNFKPYTGGSKYVPAYTRSFNLDESAQIFKTSMGIFVLTSTALYSYATPTLTLVLGSLTAGGRWSCADFGKHIVFSNGSCYVRRNPSTGVFTQDVTDTLYPQAGAMCNAGGRAILGDIKAGTEKRKYLYSEIGSMKFLSSTNLDSARGTSGFGYVPWDGQIYTVLPMGPKVGVYGSGGVLFLLPAAVEPFAVGVFGVAELDRVGVPSRAAAVAVGKDGTDGHYYLSNDGDLYFIGFVSDTSGKQSMSLKKLGYKEYITDPANAVLSYNEQDKELIVGMSSSSLIFDTVGAGVVSARIESVSYDSVNGLLMHSSSAISQTESILTTDVIDFSYPGMKTLQTVTLLADYKDLAYVSVTYKSFKNSNWVTSSWKKVNKSGVGSIGITAGEFKINVKFSPYTDPIVYGLQVGVKFSDKRFIRGAGVSYDNQADARAS